jgi:hypothetical protein
MVGISEGAFGFDYVGVGVAVEVRAPREAFSRHRPFDGRSGGD